MFVDLWLNFCCARQSKQEAQDQPLSTCEDSNKPMLDTGQAYVPSPAAQKALQSTSQELWQKLQEAQEKRQQSQQTQQQNHFQSMINKGAEKTSVEMEEWNLLKGFSRCLESNMMASWEAQEQSRQKYILNELAQFSMLAKAVCSNNGVYQGSNPCSQPTADQQIMTGQSHQQNNLAQTTLLQVVEESPKRQDMTRSQNQVSLEAEKIKKKQIQKEKRSRNTTRRGSIMQDEQKQEANCTKLWDKNEDAILKQAYINFNGNWRSIAEQLPGRNMNQCSERWRSLKPQENKKKKRWEFEDDQLIIQLVKQYDQNWAEIAKHLPGKSSSQIRERYLNKLDPSVNMNPWSKKEDEIVLKIFKEQGPKWSVAQKQLKGRTVENIRNRFYSHIGRLLMFRQEPQLMNLNDGDINDHENTLYQDDEPLKQTQSMDQSSSITISSNLDSLIDDLLADEFELSENGLFKI
ncbi:unnamed protein product [Paramecium octaurelia]|uniref:Myb-like DNA-binding domain containing protein n=1 Tax=Paramecium octaurelia TaxID=43137 RepID=A0A8S1VHR4_PAROT|nr:unnamed protein product [Paramecium octaurelia]